MLLCTGHHERTFPHKEYSSDNSGVNVAATEWLAQQGVVHFGIDSMRPGPEGKVNALVHKACLDLDITHSGEGSRGVMLLMVDRALGERLIGGLMARGYHPTLRELD